MIGSVWFKDLMATAVTEIGLINRGTIVSDGSFMLQNLFGKSHSPM